MKNIIRIVQYTKKFWVWYLVTGLFICFISLLSLVTPFLLKQVVDTIVNGLSGAETDISSVWFTLFLIVATDVSVTTLTSYSQWLGDVLTVRLQSFLSNKFYEKLQFPKIIIENSNISKGQFLEKIEATIKKLL